MYIFPFTLAKYICTVIVLFHRHFVLFQSLSVKVYVMFPFQMLIIDDSDHYCLYSDTEREELLFNIFKHICLGGKLCQYEDNIEPYLDITKQIYKDFIR